MQHLMRSVPRSGSSLRRIVFSSTTSGGDDDHAFSPRGTTSWPRGKVRSQKRKTEALLLEEEQHLKDVQAELERPLDE